MNAPMMHVVDPQTGEANPADIQRAFDAQLATSLAWRSSTAAERIARLRKLRDAMLARREDFYKAFDLDYHKPPSEVEGTEFMPVLDEIRHAMGDLKSWMRPKRVWPTMTTGGTSAWVEAQPRGRSLIIAPWNFPLNLCFGPLVSALAAGNTAIVKPSEMTPHVSAVMVSIIRDIFKEDEVAIFEGALPTSTALLALPFDHIFFTGSPAVGKVVMAAAAKHLTSVTLELGGKSPVIVDETADLKTAAETLMWGKLVNCGQTCVAPDHVYVHEAVKDKFVAECRRVITERYGDTAQAQQASPHFTHVVNQRHAQRIAGLVEDAKTRGARILLGGQSDVGQAFVAPTLLDNIPADASIMSEEIFGPVLPIITWNNLDTVIRAINAQPKPLALYIWSHNKARTRRIMTETSSGGVGINHCVLHYAHGNLPFGGVNNSGIGSAHGIYGFKAFSHERAVLKSGPIMVAKLFFPPYSGFKPKLIRMVVDSLKLPKLF
ncbi:MAG TPA: aldehyde dehydrogenase family protein [Aquabacterium sp.]|uniref:aldehyde dehydrogenase family protein n=1 Tax=Aquabacterium sp. TaxID=1872578 RepID=UPI002E2FEFD2|nr:aldehyde dehydrogenase family protein [Aquabacterium sp.]HEX5371996.1 aldehyde dehydrogenase family protein [Aquabacterium sp.]